MTVYHAFDESEATASEDLVDVGQNNLEDAVRLLWDRVTIVPLDQACLDRAALIMRDQPVKIVDATHLDAADQLPRRSPM